MGGLDGRIVSVRGDVVDVEFDTELPYVNESLEVASEGRRLLLEVHQHINTTTVRTIAMGFTEGLKRGARATRMRSPLKVPVGEATLGRIFDAMGDPVDELGALG